MERIIWKIAGETGMTKGKWTVGKYKIKGEWIYRLFDGEKGVLICRSFAECKEYVRNAQKGI